MSTVTKIDVPAAFRKNRVAAYARVSTLKECQEDSFDTQLAYYTALIRSTPNWIFIQVYSDQGFSGVNAQGRPGFQQMLADARQRKFDILLVRSISRFARNVKEAQIYCRMLKALGIEVQFERERISSMDPSTEMAFHLLAACAQEESRSISDRTQWSIHSRQAQGILHIGSKALGYQEAEGRLIPSQDAWVIQTIFAQYIQGKTTGEIAKYLDNIGFYRRTSGKKLTTSHVTYILKNPIYVGDRLLQRQPPKNYMTHKPDPSRPYDSYYIRDAHPGIIPRPLWNQVQQRLAWKASLHTCGVQLRKDSHFLYGKLFCGACSQPMKRQKSFWICMGNCDTPPVQEDRLLSALCTHLACSPTDLPMRSQPIDRILWREDAIQSLTFFV